MSSPRSIFDSTDVFSGLSAQERDKIYALTVQLELPANHEIFQENEPEADFYIVLSGVVDIQVHVPTEDRQETLTQIRKGGVLGEFSLIDRSRRSASAIARSPVSLLQIDGDAFIKLCEEDHRLGYLLMSSMARLLCRKLRETNLQWHNVIMYK